MQLNRKVQARFAFATYLMRVQQRLLHESSADGGDEHDQANEQMVRGIFDETLDLKINKIERKYYTYIVYL